MYRPTVSHKDYLKKRLGDPATAAAYIDAAASDEDPGALLQALRNVAEAHGGCYHGVSNHHE